MSRPQSGVSPFRTVGLRPSEILHQKEVKASSGSGHVFLRVHWAKQRILFYALIELVHEFHEKILATDSFINLHTAVFLSQGQKPRRVSWKRKIEESSEGYPMDAAPWIGDSLATTRLFSDMPEEALQQLIPAFVERIYQAGEAVFHQGDPGESLFVIGTGQVRIEREILDGTPVTLALRGPGSVIGELALLDGSPRSASVYALGTVKGLSLARSAFLGFLADNAPALKSLLAILSQRLRESDQRIEDLGSKTMVQRLAGALLKLASSEGDSTHDGIVLSSTVNYQLLTGLLCTNRESVSRAIRSLRESDLLDKSGRLFVLTDPQGLSDLYEEG